MPDQPTPKPSPLTAEEVVDRLVAKHVTEGDRIPAAAVADAIRERDESHATDLRTWIKMAMRCEKHAQNSEAEAAALRESLASAEKQIEELKRTSGGIPPPDTTTQAVALIAASALLAHGGIGT